MGQSCVEYLAENFEEVSPLAFYRDLFPQGHLDKRNAFTKGKYCGIAVQIGGKYKARRHILTDELDNLEDLLSSDTFTVISPLSYAGRTQEAINQADCYALAVDLDNVVNDGKKPWGLIDLIAHVEKVGRIPRPSYIVASSDNNLHLYYLLEEPIHLYKTNRDSLARYKTFLTRLIWNRYTTDSYSSIQQEPIGQSMRAVGSISKDGKSRVRAFKYSGRVNVDYLNSFVFEEGNEITIWDKPDSSKSKRKTTKLRGINSNEGFYNRYKEKFLDYTADGRRYFGLMMLAVVALKCGVSRERLEADALAFVPALDEMTEREDNHFKEEDALKAITAYDVPHFMFMKRETIVRRSGVPFEPNKRNGRPQAVHCFLMRNQRAALNAIGEGHAGNAGRPTKEAMVIEYKEKHPEKSNRQIAEELGINRNTVNKWVKALKESKNLKEVAKALADREKRAIEL